MWIVPGAPNSHVPTPLVTATIAVTWRSHVRSPMAMIAPRTRNAIVLATRWPRPAWRNGATGTPVQAAPGARADAPRSRTSCPATVDDLDHPHHGEQGGDDEHRLERLAHRRLLDVARATWRHRFAHRWLRSRRIVGRLPLIVVCLIAAITASAAASGTSTVEKRSAMSIGPMSRPLRSDSLAMAPTRSPGRMRSLRPRPMNSRVWRPPWSRPPGWPGAGGDARAGRRRSRPGRSVARHELGDLGLVDRASPGLVGQLDGGEGDVADVELAGERRRPTRRYRSRSSALRGPRAARPVVSSIWRARRSATVGTFSIAIGLPRDPLDVAEQPLLARLGERDRDALAAGPADAADAVHVGLGRRRHVVVDDVRELVDVEPAGGDVGGDEQLGGAGAQPPHHPVALLLGHAAVQRLGAVAAAVQRLGELVDLGARAAEDDRRRRRLDVEDAAERGRLVGARRRRRPAGAPAAPRPASARRRLDLDAHRVAQVALGDAVDARRHRRREQHRLALGRRRLEDRLDVLGEAHVEHLVGLVEHDDAHAVERQRAAADVVERPARRGDDDVDAARAAR